MTETSDGKKIKGLMPIILEKLLKERKDTRKKMLYKTITFPEDPKEEFFGLYKDHGDGTFSLFNIEENENVLDKEPINEILTNT